MDNATEESIMDIIGKLKKIDYINPEDIPNIDLYMDQVTTFMDEHLACLLYTSILNTSRKQIIRFLRNCDFFSACGINL